MLYQALPVEIQPEISIYRWTIRKAIFGPNDTSHHVVGRWHDEGGRASSAIQSFDPVTAIIVTRSGRQYLLSGDPGLGGDSEYVWNAWKKINNVLEDSDVTQEYIDKIAAVKQIQD